MSAAKAFWYLATQFTHHPEGLANAEREAAMAAARLIRENVFVFSPIVHACPLARWGGIDPLDDLFWMRADRPFMRIAHGLIVLTTTGWEVSSGIKEEIVTFASASKPIVMWDPKNSIPPEVLK